MLADFASWLHQPFSPNMNASRWIGFMGLLLAGLLLWGWIIRRMEEL